MNSKSRLTRFSVATLLGVCAVSAYGHHGWVAHYDRDSYVRVEGTVHEIEFVNPHAYVYIDTINAQGENEVRWCEMQARTQLERRGVTIDSFAIGGPIVVEGFVSRRDPLGCETGTIRLTDGQVVVFRERNGQSVYGAPEVAGETSVLGTWYPKVFLAEAGSETDSVTRLTEAAIEAHDAFDWITQNPTLSCSPASNIRAWSAPGLPTEIRRQGETIVIHHEFMDTIREIDLTVTEHPVDGSRTDLGHSIARFEGDELVIETQNFAAGALWAGRLNTTGLKTMERLSIDAATGELVLNWTVTDPDYYPDPITGTRVLIRTNLSMGSFDCVPSAGHRPRDGYQSN
ncbi:MAG: DUF6152 family protein [Gammaproteobacteria bacterium]